MYYIGDIVDIDGDGWVDEETEFPTLIGDLKKTLIENVAVTEMKLGDLTNLSNFSDGWTNKISELYDMFND